MPALSSLQRWSHQNNILIHWGMVGSMMLGLATLCMTMLSWPTVMIGFVPFYLAAEFFSAILDFKNNTHLKLPFSVRKYQDLLHWWKSQTPSYVSSHNGNKVLARDEFPGQSLYDANGVWIGTWYTHHEINLMTLLNLKENGTSIPSSTWFEPAKSFRRLPWLARLRSPKLPTSSPDFRARRLGHLF